MRLRIGALIGVPIAALMAMYVVILLRFGAGPIEFKGLGFEFRGAAGQVVLDFLLPGDRFRSKATLVTWDSGSAPQFGASH